MGISLQIGRICDTLDSKKKANIYCNYYTRDTQNNWRGSKLFLEKDNTMKWKEQRC